jgi:hypothetical protein
VPAAEEQAEHVALRAGQRRGAVDQFLDVSIHVRDAAGAVPGVAATPVPADRGGRLIAAAG